MQQISKYIETIVLQEKVITNKSTKAKKVNNEHEFQYEKERMDQISNPTNERELMIPMGYFGIINLYNISENAIKFKFEGLGSGIALILSDKTNKIYAMSHIGFANSSVSKQNYHLIFPHTFADTSVKDLYNHLIYHGANKHKITAIIIGGAKLFSDLDKTYQKNIEAIKSSKYIEERV